MDLYKQCKDLFGRNRRLIVKDRDSCSRDFLQVIVGRDLYRLYRSHGWRPTFRLYPQGKYAGHGSFACPDGSFEQHGGISRTDFAQVITMGNVIPRFHKAA